MTADVLSRLKALCDAATPGKWEVDDTGEWVVVEDEADNCSAENSADSRFIAASRQIVPALVELVECLEWELECREGTLHYYTWTPPRSWPHGINELTKTYKAATAAVEAAWKNLEAVCPPQK